MDQINDHNPNADFGMRLPVGTGRIKVKRRNKSPFNLEEPKLPIDSDIQKVQFAHSKGSSAPIEVIRLSELRTRKLDVDISAPTRQDFYHLMFVTEGSGAHWADFTRHSLREGDVFPVRPDQVHAFDTDSDHEALILLFRPEAIPSDQSQPLSVHLNRPFHPEPEDFRLLVKLLRFLIVTEEDNHSLRLSSMAPGLLRAITAGLDDLCARQSEDLQSATYRRAAELVHRFEHLLHQENGGRALSKYIDLLHVTPRTLARATHLVRGLSPKKLIDQRVALEAKRKLILSDDTVEEIAFDLKFTEATNFVKFFKRITDSTPEAFRNEQRALHG